MENYPAALIILIAINVIIIFMATILKKTKKETTFSYTTKKVLFTQAERSFLGVLEKSIEKDVQIFGKVRVADILEPKKNYSKSNWQKAFNKISAKHFDFVLCNKSDLSVICTIELNDKSHRAKSRRERDKFLRESCHSAGLKLLEFTAKKSYKIEEVKNKISEENRNNNLSSCVPYVSRHLSDTALSKVG